MAKPLNEPGKKQLVEQKRELNESVSRSVDKLFSAKDAWNGKSAPDIGVSEPHSIIQPIPQEAITAFQEAIDVLNGANKKLQDIAREQGGQAHERVKFKENKPSGLDLSSIASNTMTRMLSHMKAPFQFGDSNKWARLKLLRSAANAKTHLEEINSLILSKSNLSIPKAVYKAKDLYYIIDNELFEPVTTALRDLPEIPKTTKKTEEFLQQPAIDEMQERDPNSGHPYEYMEIEYGLKSMRNELLELRRRLSPESFKQFEERWRDLNRRRDYVQSLLKTNYNAAEIEHRNLISEIQDLRNNIDDVSMGFEKGANTFSRFLKRKNIEYLTLPSNHQKSIRLKADKKIQSMYSIIDNLMGALEKPYIDPASLSSYLYKLSNTMMGLYETLASLGEIYNSEIKMIRHKDRKKRKKIASRTNC